MNQRFKIEPLSPTHDRTRFSCGNARIDAYFREQVSQDVKRDYASCFVMRDQETGAVAGFYTLSASNIPLTEIPDDLKRKLPRYPTVPAVLIGWLGRHTDYAGLGAGGVLLFDALQTIIASPIGAHAAFAQAIDESAGAFYLAHGFRPLQDRSRTLFLPIAKACGLLTG